VTYSSASNVFSYFRSALSASSAFSSGTRPSSTDITRFLGAGYSKINTALKAKGYSTPVSSTATCYDEVVELETIYAAAMGYQSLDLQRVSPQARTKGELLMGFFNDQLKGFLHQDLSCAGLTLAHDQLYAGGISIDDKDAVEESQKNIDSIRAEIKEYNKGKPDDKQVIINRRTLRERLAAELEGAEIKKGPRQARSRIEQLREAYGR